MTCGSCGGDDSNNGSYIGNNRGDVCRQDIPYPMVSPESVPSLITNLVIALYGGFCTSNIPIAGTCIQKAIVNGSVVWLIPCDPNRAWTVAGIPRLPGEGLMCYIIRILTIFNPADYVTINGFQTVTNKTFSNTTFRSLLDFGSSQPFGGVWDAIPIPNLKGSVIGSIAYQSGVNITTQLAPGPAGYVLATNGPNLPPSWIVNTSVSVSANNILGGQAGQLLWQTAGSTTNFVAVGTTNQVLTANGTNVPTWVNSVNSSVNIAGGSVGLIPVQTVVGTTGFLPSGTVNQVLTSNGVGKLPTWNTINNSIWRNLITNPIFSVDQISLGLPFPFNTTANPFTSGFFMDTWVGGSTPGYTGVYTYQRSRTLQGNDANQGLLISYNTSNPFNAHLEQYIEGLLPSLIWSQNNLPQNMVLSFIFRSSDVTTSTTSILWQIEGTNSGDNWSPPATRTTLASGTIPTSSITPNTYQKITIPFNIGSYIPGLGLHVKLIVSNPNYVANTTCFFNQVQLEFGTVASPFEIEPYGIMATQVYRYSQFIDYHDSTYANYTLGDRGVTFYMQRYSEGLWNNPNVYLPAGMSLSGVNTIALDFRTITGFSLQATLNTNYTGQCIVSTTAAVRPPIRILAELISDVNPITASPNDYPVLPDGYTYKWCRRLNNLNEEPCPVRIHPDGSLLFISMDDKNPVYQSFLAWKQAYEASNNEIAFYN